MKNEKNIYILIQFSGEPSGAEKRFINIWKKFNSKNNKSIFLMTHKKTLDYFSFSSIEKENILLFDTKKTNYISQYIAVFKLLNKIEKNSIIHFVNTYYPFLSLFSRSCFVISWLQPFNPISLKNLKFYHIILFFIGFIFSKHIDVLNPKNYKNFKKFFFFKRILNTPTSNNIDKKLFIPDIKDNSLVFLGRFEMDKGIDKLIRIIPYLENKLNNQNKIDVVNIFIIGKGKEQEKINDLINQKYKSLKITNLYSDKPHIFLNKAKVFLSLQKSSNYPSRSLVEAMYSGCLPIITDAGDSKLVGDDKKLFFVEKNIKPDDLSDLIIKIFNLKREDYKELSEKIREDAISKFDNDDQFKYFSNIYLKN